EADRGDARLTVTFQRVALTADQVRRFQLPTVPPKSSDSRAKRWTGATCQLEALPPDIIAGLLQQAIESVLDLEQIDRDREIEQQERTELAYLLPPGEPPRKHPSP